MDTEKSKTPLVYSCSGCSTAGQLANQLALRMSKLGIAEMSCIAGIGGNVKKLVRLAKSGRSILAIDGCPLACVKSCLAVHQLTPTHHIRLDRWGIEKSSSNDLTTNKDNENRMLEEITKIMNSSN